MALLLETVVRATVTEDMLKWERDCGLFSESQINKYHSNLHYSTDENGAVTIQNCSNTTLDYGKDLNFNHVTAQYVVNTIISEADRQEARERIQKAKTEGCTLRDRLRSINKKLTAGKMVLDLRKYHFDDHILNCVKKSVETKKDIDASKMRREELQYMKLCFKADEVLKKHMNKNVEEWSSKIDIKTFLNPLKEKNDPKMPSGRNELIARYREQKHRNRKYLSNNESI